jgi:hypothetical protein
MKRFRIFSEDENRMLNREYKSFTEVSNQAHIRELNHESCIIYEFCDEQELWVPCKFNSMH